MAHPAYMALCQLGTVLTDLRTGDEQARWGERLGEAWDYRTTVQGIGATARCCRLLWPSDKCCANMFSKPTLKSLNLYVPGALVNRRLVGA